IQSWQQLLAKPDGGAWKIGVLGASQADTYLTSLATDEGYRIEVVRYSGNTDAMDHVASGMLDATVADDCVADFYIDRFPNLRLVGWPVDGGYFVGLVGHGETRLLAAL